MISTIYTFGIIKVFNYDENAFALSLPFSIFSTVCYILTEEKNKTLFYCMWCPSILGVVLQYLAANTIFSAIGLILSISNTGGVLFVRDLFSEFINSAKAEKRPYQMKINRRFSIVCCSIISIAFFLQLSFNCFFLFYERVPNIKDCTKVENGPLSQLYLNNPHFENYESCLKDLDIIKTRSKKSDPILITSSTGWMYLYIDRPIAAHCANLLTFDTELLSLYYEQNPDKIPKYIYVSFMDHSYDIDLDAVNYKLTQLSEMFSYTQEELSMGILLTIKN